jgi:hypothetical protein
MNVVVAAKKDAAANHGAGQEEPKDGNGPSENVQMSSLANAVLDNEVIAISSLEMVSQLMKKWQISAEPKHFKQWLTAITAEGNLFTKRQKGHADGLLNYLNSKASREQARLYTGFSVLKSFIDHIDHQKGDLLQCGACNGYFTSATSLKSHRSGGCSSHHDPTEWPRMNGQPVCLLCLN